MLEGEARPGPQMATREQLGAYVRDNVLVAKVDALPFTLGASTNGYVTMKLSGAVLQGRLVRDGDGFRVDRGQIVGRWKTSDLLPSLSIYNDPLTPAIRLCGSSSGTYVALKQTICTSVDVAADPAATAPP